MDADGAGRAGGFSLVTRAAGGHSAGMSDTVVLGILAVASYLIGAIPFGLLIARIKGVDIRKVGSGNIGATNVMRSVGKPWGIATFICDALKGLLPAALFPLLGGRLSPAFATPELASVVSGVGAILGHNFPVYLGFKGGKGVATSAGALIGIAPLGVAIGVGVWAIVFFIFRYVSLASIIAAAGIVIAGWMVYREGGLLIPITLTILGALAIYRHKANIQRLLAGTEHRFDKKANAEKEGA